MNIGIFGGSFNPIHNGHIALAKVLLRECCLQEVWFVVSPQNPFKVGEHLLDDEVRFQLAWKALKPYSQLIASDVELHLPKPSYTWRTLQELSLRYPNHHFTLLIGGDNWDSFPRWAHSDYLLSHYDIAVYPRTNGSVAATTPQNVKIVNAPLLNISSTDIRHRVAQGQSISGLVPKEIEQDVERLYCLSRNHNV